MTFDVPRRGCRVEEAGPLRYLMSGDMIHGAQYLDGERRGVPVPYHPSPGPVGDLFALADDPSSRVGVVGLGTGGLAVHGRPAQPMVFFEYDPRVVELAREAFSYLERATAAVEVVVEEGRRALQGRPAGEFDLIVLDAFVADAVPSHLLTREALAEFHDRIGADGTVAFHVSNKIVDLPAVIGNAARAEGLVVWTRSFDPRGDEKFDDLFVKPTRWVAATSPEGASARRFRNGDGWRALGESAEHPLWRDEDAQRIELFR